MASDGNDRVKRRNGAVQLREAPLHPANDGARRRAAWAAAGPIDTAFPIHVALRQARLDLAGLARLLAAVPGARKTVQQLLGLDGTLGRVGEMVLGLEREVAQLRHFAYHDDLTGLPNRTLLLDRLDRALAQAVRRHGRAALLMLDLNGFKSVNDRFGHAVGDELLREVARRLLACTRDADTTSRYGGDEFIVLLPDVEGADSATAVAAKVRSCLREPFAIGDRSIVVTACIGIAVYPSDGATADALIAHADTAMYVAKQDVVDISGAFAGPRKAGVAPASRTRELGAASSAGE